MHRKRFFTMAGISAAALTLMMGQLHSFAFVGHPAAATQGGEFPPLFARRLEVGIMGMDGPADRVHVARLELYEDDATFVLSASPLSYCVGSACLESVCVGSACVKSYCVGSGCGGSSCVGSGCGGSICLGSACIGSGCLGSACTHCLEGEEPVETEL